MVGESAPTASTNRLADRGCRPVARQIRTPRARAAAIAATTPGGTTFDSGTSVPSMSVTSTRYRTGSAKGEAHLRPRPGAAVAGLHELGGPQAVLRGHRRGPAV